MSKIHDFLGGMFCQMQLNANTWVKLLRLTIIISFTKMKENNISQSGDYDAQLCEQQYTHGSCLIYLFVQIQIIWQFNTPKTASNFRHLLSCGTIVRQCEILAVQEMYWLQIENEESLRIISRESWELK